MKQEKKAGDNGKIGEKRERFLNPGKSENEKNRREQPPVLLLALLLVLGILGGFMLSILISPETPQSTEDPEENINDVSYRTVPITMLYSSDCMSCRQTNTIEELFVVRQIPYTMKKVDIASEEGKRILERFDIKTVPTAIIDQQKMGFYPTTRAQFDNVLKKQNTAYVAPELNLNENAYYPSYYLERVPGFCSGEKPTIVEFDDYYTLENARERANLYGFMQDFNTHIDYKYVFAQISSADNNAIMANLFLTCAGQQGKFIELERAITGIYCNNPFKGDETILTDVEVLGCWTLSNRFGTPLTQIELDHALGRIEGLDTNAFTACIENKGALLTNAEQTTKELGITKVPPGGLFLLDCRETASGALLEEAFCSRHPEVEACAGESAQ